MIKVAMLSVEVKSVDGKPKILKRKKLSILYEDLVRFTHQ